MPQIITSVAPRLKWKAAGLWPERLGFNPIPVSVGFVVDKQALGQASFRIPVFSPVSIIPSMLHTRIFHQPSTLYISSQFIESLNKTPPLPLQPTLPIFLDSFQFFLLSVYSFQFHARWKLNGNSVIKLRTIYSLLQHFHQFYWLLYYQSSSPFYHLCWYSWGLCRSEYAITGEKRRLSCMQFTALS